MTNTAPEHQEKSYCAIKVGKDRCYWMAVRFGVYIAHCCTAEGEPSPDPAWLIGEGFEATLEAALATARATADAAPGPWAQRRDWRHPGWGYGAWDRDFYSKFRARARKPKPSAASDARPEGALGYLWEFSSVCSDWDPTPAELASMRQTRAEYDRERWLSRWTSLPVTKITAKRIWVANPNNHGSDRRQLSFDRAKLEREGRVFGKHWFISYYTEAGKAAEFGGQSDAASIRAMFPLLGLSATPTRKQVMAAFRRRSKELHPDAGGDAEHFRNLVAEKDRALGMAA